MKQRINARTRVYEVMKLYPGTTDYLLELNICGCSLGEIPGKRSIELTLEDVARERNINLEKFLEELNRRI
ncbi:hypothetical protein BMS3Bbin15_01875 [archaeon BMS3Bbin15]|nr:hypothetical protein BMS3Bbin15_01875 [archaeon BMS3Bbin15]